MILRAVSAAIMAGGLAACTVGPDYQRPPLELGESYLYANDGWQQSAALENHAEAAWWQGFGDPNLNVLMRLMPDSNADLARAQARYREALANLDAAGAPAWPTLGASSSMSRTGQSASVADVISLGLNASWEPDLWGRVRRASEAAQAAVTASGADLAGVRLSLQAALARAWVALAGAREQHALLERTAAAYREALELTRNKFAAGVVTAADVASASQQLEAVHAQQIRQQAQIQLQENAIAVLLGRTPAGLQELLEDPAKNALGATISLHPALSELQLVQVPLQAPARLLLRRPDVASAEQLMIQANARIGVAKTAWLPQLTLSAQGGMRAAEFASWFAAPARFWSLGPALALAVFDGGARSAALAGAGAAYDAQAAAWRQSVLQAVREVEDALLQAEALTNELQARERALAGARASLNEISNQYHAGLVDYLSVVQVQSSALSAEQSVLDLRAQILNNAIALTSALGGGWD